MKSLLLLFVLLLVAFSGIAQDSAAARPTPPLAAQVAPDTAAAIHRLFAARRVRSYAITGLLVTPGILGLLVDGNSIGTAVYPIAAAPFELANLICHRRYRKKAEKRAMANLQTHQLSPKIRRKLKPKYFTDAPASKHF